MQLQKSFISPPPFRFHYSTVFGIFQYPTGNRAGKIRLREAQHHWAQAHIIAKHIICRREHRSNSLFFSLFKQKQLFFQLIQLNYCNAFVIDLHLRSVGRGHFGIPLQNSAIGTDPGITQTVTRLSKAKFNRK